MSTLELMINSSESLLEAVDIIDGKIQPSEASQPARLYAIRLLLRQELQISTRESIVVDPIIETVSG